MSRGKIEYVSKKIVVSMYRHYETVEFFHIEKEVSQKYEGLFSDTLIREISSVASAKLMIPLYLQSATYKDSPSYRQQLTILYDFRQLLNGDVRRPKYFAVEKKYYHCYAGICALLDGHQYYQKTGEVSSEFFRVIPELGKENFPTEHAEEYLLYAREMTLVMIDKATNMVRDQIYGMFPSKAPEFVRVILQENLSNDAESMNYETSTETKRVTFSI